MNVLKLIAVAVLAVFAATAIPLDGSGSLAFAQQNKQRRQEFRPPNLLDMLFGGGRQQRTQQERRAKPNQGRRVLIPLFPGFDLRQQQQARPEAPRQKRTGGAQVVKAPPKPVVPKVDNAAKVLVVGDFMADALHAGLEQAYAENPNVVTVNEASGQTGLVRDDIVNWPERTAELIETLRPVAVVVLVGMNDRQQMVADGGRVEKLSDPWRAEYDKRIEKLVSAVRARNVTLLWLGLPPVKSKAMNTDFLLMNDMYQAKVEAAGGRFIDVWDGFTNAEGAFVSAGPDVNGQIVRLRNSDGIAMTNAGKEKLGFYATRELKRILGLGDEQQIAALGGETAVEELRPEYNPALTGKTVVISFDSGQADGGDVLDGGEPAGADANQAASTSTIYSLVAMGKAAQPRPGRVDAAWGLPDIERPKSIEELKAAGAGQPRSPRVPAAPQL